MMIRILATHSFRTLRLLFAVAAAVAAGGFLMGCSHPPSNQLQGYIEGEFIYVASPLAGALEKLPVQRGAQVKAGDPLFELESRSEKAALDEAGRRLAQAKASLEDAKKGKRTSEVASIEAQVQQARIALELSEKDLVRQDHLLQITGATTQQDIDRIRSTRDQDRQRLTQLEADLETAHLGSRPDQIAGAEANVHALEAAVARAEWGLSQKRQNAPEGGTVIDTVYRPGEWVAAGRPVVSLLPPEGVKLRVFVPQTWLVSLHTGDSVLVLVDGAGAPVTARISFISPRAEYTPPVIYSRENRNKFVFLIEAVFEPSVAAQLHPGQPVDVKFNISVQP